MTTYEPGRIYSVEQYGQRHLAVYRDSGMFVYASGGGGSSEFYRISGPLVVLDNPDERLADSWRLLSDFLRQHNWTNVADQIEEQTRPPLQVGVHLAWSRSEGRRAYMCWDGNFWWYSDLNKSLADWESVHYIGPASEDQS